MLQHQPGEALWHIEQVLSGRLAAGGGSGGGGAASCGQAEQHRRRNAVTRRRHQVRLHAARGPLARGRSGSAVRRSAGLSLLLGDQVVMLDNALRGSAALLKRDRQRQALGPEWRRALVLSLLPRPS